MMNRAMVPKKIPMSFMFITFLSMVASGKERPTTDIISVSYKYKNLTANIFCQNLFKRNGKIEEVENHNRLAHKLLIAHNRNTSNAFGIKLTWTLSKGRKFKGIDRDTNSLKDKETGVAK